MSFDTNFTRKFLKITYTQALLRARACMANYPNSSSNWLERCRFWENRLKALRDIEILPNVVE
jgi:hypothetical protein